jgi:Domain of Unknown Function with PDB structure (DUF3857)
MKFRIILFGLMILVIQTCFGGIVFGQEDDTQEIITIIENAPPASQYPDAAAVTLKHEKIITVNPDYSSVSEEHLIIKILSDLGKRRYGDQKRRYNSDSDSIVVILARTFDKEMTIIDVEEKAINDITPASLSGASMYSNIMQKVISFPALEKGVTIELKLKKYSGAPEEGEKVFVWGTDMFQKTDPILSKERRLIIPKGMDVKHIVQNEGVSYITDSTENSIIHAWKTTYASQIIPEPNMPPITRIAPRLVYTSADSWEEVGVWFGEKFYPHLKANKSLKKKVKEFRKESKNDEEVIEKISIFVIQKVREINLTLGLAGYEPHDAADVFDNKYGDWLDKTVLLITMLKEAGIEAFPVFINNEDAVTAEDMPSLRQFSALYVYLPQEEGKEPLWINPFADYCPFGYFPYGQGSTCLLVKESGSELIKAFNPSAEDNAVLTRADYRLNSNGDIVGEIAIQLSGYFDFSARLALRDMKEFEIKQYFQRTANNIGLGSESVKSFMSEPEDLTLDMVVSQTIKSPEIGIVEGDMMIFEMPDLPFDFLYSPYPSLDFRFYDFMVQTDLVYNIEGDIILPEGYKVAYIPGEFQMSNDFADLSFKYDHGKDGGIIHYIQTIKLKDNLVPVDDYDDFKEIFDQYSMRQNKIILLEKI